MKIYESSFFSFCENTSYPFYEFTSLSKYFLDISMVSDSPMYLTKVYKYDKLELTFNGVVYVINYAGLGDYPLNDLGYIRINTLPEYINENCNMQVMDSCLSKENLTYNGVSNVIAGYNCQIDIIDNEVSLIPNLGEGKGVYCGEEPPKDAVFSINGMSPDDDGNINFNHLYYFKIRNGENKLYLSLTIPEDRLNCTRPGFPGEPGWEGPNGIKGETGDPAPEVKIEYNYCESPYRNI